MTKYIHTSGCRQNHVGILGSCSDLCNPSSVTRKGAAKCHLVRHFYAVRCPGLPGWHKIIQSQQSAKPSAMAAEQEKETGKLVRSNINRWRGTSIFITSQCRSRVKATVGVYRTDDRGFAAQSRLNGLTRHCRRNACTSTCTSAFGRQRACAKWRCP